MRKVLIHEQTPTKIIYNGIEYKSLGEFARKYKFYSSEKKKLLQKFIWKHFGFFRTNNTYNIDEARELLREKLRLYLKGESTRSACGIKIIYKKKLYLSVNSLGRELGFTSKNSLHRILKKYFGEEKLKNSNKIIIKKRLEKIIENRISLLKEEKRPDCIKIYYSNKYKNYVFNSLVELAKTINVKIVCLRSFMYRKGIKPENHEINLDLPKYKIFREYIEKKDSNKNLIPLKNKIIDFAEQSGINANQILLFAKNKGIKNIEEIKKYYQYLL